MSDYVRKLRQARRVRKHAGCPGNRPTVQCPHLTPQGGCIVLSRDVSFYSSGSKISAVLNWSENQSENLPCVVFGHGYTSYKDEFGGFIDLAELFCAAGFSVLRIDFRGAGESIDTNARGKMLIATEWSIDMANAAVYAAGLESTDPDRISILGVSGGGGAVLSAAKYLPDIACVVALAPVCSGRGLLERLWLAGHGQERWQAFCARVLDEQRNLIEHNIDDFIDVPEVLAFPEADWEVWKANARAFPLAAQQVTFSSVADLMFRVDSLREVRTYRRPPVLFVHGTADTLVSPDGTQAMYDAYAGPKDLVWLDGQPHGFLLEPGCERYTQPIVDWVKAHQPVA